MKKVLVLSSILLLGGCYYPAPMPMQPVVAVAPQPVYAAPVPAYPVYAAPYYAAPPVSLAIGLGFGRGGGGRFR